VTPIRPLDGDRVLVTGAGGFIGHHLTTHLVGAGHWVRGVDLAHPRYGSTNAHEFQRLDLRSLDACLQATRDVDVVYALAANMGGIGFIETHKAQITRDNTLIDLHTIEAARRQRVQTFLFASSACVYPGYRQQDSTARALREEDAYPAEAEDGYGWEKLYMERVCRHYWQDYGLDTRVVRLHNVYGPLGSYDGGREKSPAAICRKVVMATNPGTIEVWGDGQQQRSYCYVDDCIEGLVRVMRSDHREPLNLGTDRLVSINDLVAMVATIAGKTISTRHNLARPQGVRSRNCDTTKLGEILNWKPMTPLERGLAITYRWIASRLDG
jgi:GDP-D-mannose 3',5'-epimerase